MQRGKARIYRSGRAYTMYISVPADVVKDTSFPFDREEGEDVVVRIDGKRLIVETPRRGSRK